MADGGTVWIWATAILAVSVGFAVGFLVAYVAVLRDGNASKLRQELDHQKAEFDAYRGRVDDHFVRTSELFQDMTRQYGALYEHLAGGAQSLCSDRLVTHRPSVPESMPMVEHKTGAGATAKDTAAEPKSEPGPELPAAAAPADNEVKQAAPAEPEPEAVASERRQQVDESELESFAPRPEASTLREPASAPVTEPGAGSQNPEPKPRLH